MEIKTVKYQIGTYSGKIDVNCDPDDDNDIIIGKAKRQLRKYDTLGMAYRSYKVIN